MLYVVYRTLYVILYVVQCIVARHFLTVYCSTTYSILSYSIQRTLYHVYSSMCRRVEKHDQKWHLKVDELNYGKENYATSFLLHPVTYFPHLTYIPKFTYFPPFLPIIYMRLALAVLIPYLPHPNITKYIAIVVMLQIMGQGLWVKGHELGLRVRGYNLWVKWDKCHCAIYY